MMLHQFALTARRGCCSGFSTMNRLTCNYASDGSEESERFCTPRAKGAEDRGNARNGSESGAVFAGAER